MAANSKGPMKFAELDMSDYSESLRNNSQSISRNKPNNVPLHNSMFQTRPPGLNSGELAVSGVNAPSSRNVSSSATVHSPAATKYSTSLPLSNINKAINILKLYNSRGVIKTRNDQISDLQRAILEIQKEIHIIREMHGGKRKTHKRLQRNKHRHTRARK